MIVIGLDAADYELAQRWNCDHMLLENHQKIETFAHTKDYPITAEVWPTIATGQMPKGDGKRGSDWNGLMGIADKVAKMVLSDPIRRDIGRYLRSGKVVSDHFGMSDGDHVFNQGAVFNWPGITPAKNWARSEYWLAKLNQGEVTDEEFLRIQMSLTGQELGWAVAMSQIGVPIVGTRCHILDHTGHAWCNDKEKLKTVYITVDELLNRLYHSETSDIVVISDHGMQTSFMDDDDPGRHSWRSMISINTGHSLPEHVRDVRGWLEGIIPDKVLEYSEWDQTTMGTHEEHLKDLGYIQ